MPQMPRPPLGASRLTFALPAAEGGSFRLAGIAAEPLPVVLSGGTETQARVVHAGFAEHDQSVMHVTVDIDHPLPVPKLP